VQKFACPKLARVKRACLPQVGLSSVKCSTQNVDKSYDSLSIAIGVRKHVDFPHSGMWRYQI